MAEPKKPTGGKAMDDLMGKLMQVPKRELAAQVKRYQRKKRKRSK
jgi:hypothetical protein